MDAYLKGFVAGYEAAKQAAEAAKQADMQTDMLAESIYNIKPTDTPFLRSKQRLYLHDKPRRKLSAAHKAAISRAAKKRARKSASAKGR